VSNTLTWTAAAKPFGYLDEAQRPTRYRLVLPAYHEARLIPVDASSAPAGGGYNVDWQRHVRDHLPAYMEHGPDPASSCRYCRQLVVWEMPAFRQAGVAWLDENSAQCDARDGGHGGRGGGTRRGH
jgi:hypothetical protein